MKQTVTYNLLINPAITSLYVIWLIFFFLELLTMKIPDVYS